jgi:hypothetical protein
LDETIYQMSNSDDIHTPPDRRDLAGMMTLRLLRDQDKLIAMLFAILTMKLQKARWHMHTDLALCYLREVTKTWNRNFTGSARLIFSETQRKTCIELIRQSYRTCQILEESGVDTHFLCDAKDRAAFAAYEDYTMFSDDALIGLCGDRCLKRNLCKFQAMTQHQYELILRIAPDLLIPEVDLTIHRPKYFPDTRLLALASEDVINDEMYITCESAPFLTVDRLQKLMNISDRVRKSIGRWVARYMTRDDRHLRDYYVSSYARCEDYLTISIFLPFMTRDVIRFVKSHRGTCHPSWLEMVWQCHNMDRRMFGKIAFVADVEDWYRNQEWSDLKDILFRMDNEIRCRYSARVVDADDSDLSDDSCQSPSTSSNMVSSDDDNQD